MSKEFDDFDDFDDLDEEAPEQEEENTFAELSPGEYKKLIKDLENFNFSSISHLAGTANYEIIPTESEDGTFLKEEHYRLIKKECAELGAAILYSYKIGNATIIVNPKTMKTVVLREGEAH